MIVASRRPSGLEAPRPDSEPISLRWRLAAVLWLSGGVSPAPSGLALCPLAGAAWGRMLDGMSKAFTSEETVDAPAIVQARAPLPAGVPNYVTRRGLQR